MLVLGRKLGEAIVVDFSTVVREALQLLSIGVSEDEVLKRIPTEMVVRVMDIRTKWLGNDSQLSARLGFEASKKIKIDRMEVYKKIHSETNGTVEIQDTA